MGRSGNGLTTSLSLITRNMSKIKQKAKFATTDVCIQKFVKILDKFKYIPYHRWIRKEVKNKPTGDDVFLFKQFYKFIKSKQNIVLCTRIVKSDMIKK